MVNVSPWQLQAPGHVTFRPTIPSLIVRSAFRHGIPPDVALRRGWAESGWQDINNRNRFHVFDVGPMQVNSYYTPEVLKMTLEDKIDTGVSYLSKWWYLCDKNEACAIQAYMFGHMLVSRTQK